MCGVLLSGAAQLIFLDSVPPYAAIDESVEWAKQTIRPGAGRLTNAVLRRIAGAVTEDHRIAPPGRWNGTRSRCPTARP